MSRNRFGVMAAALFTILCTNSVKTHAFSSGYILTGAYSGTKTILFDSLGKIAHEWDHSKLANPKSGYSCYLLKSGNLLRSAIVPDGTAHTSYAPSQGIIQEIDPNGSLIWSYTLASTDSGMLHHDMKVMPNGHIIGVAFVPLTRVQMKSYGIDTVLLSPTAPTKFILSERIVEIDPKAAGGPKIVWQWKIHDHVIPDAQAADHPELISGSIVKQCWNNNQWVHLNGLDYDAKNDLILFSSRIFSECYIIDHSTTIQEAAGHTGGMRNKGGDILYRWGNPKNYKASGATTISVLHCVNWIPEGYPGAGDIIFFHNNSTSTTSSTKILSQVIEIKPPMDAQCNFSKTAGQPFAPTQPTWLLAPTDTFFSSFAMSSAFRLPNGNTLVHLAYPPAANSGPFGSTTGSSMVVEADKDKKITWKFTIELKSDATPMAQAFNPAKIMYYEQNYEGITNLLKKVAVQKQKTNQYSGLKSFITQTSSLIHFCNVNECRIDIFNTLGMKVASMAPTGNSLDLSVNNYKSGLYCAKIISRDNKKTNATFSIIR